MTSRALVSEIEEDNKGMPVLLRHYLRLNARLLSFNVDPAFGHCIDGLIVVDLRTTEPKILERFMGEEGHLRFARRRERGRARPPGCCCAAWPARRDTGATSPTQAQRRLSRRARS